MNTFTVKPLTAGLVLASMLTVGGLGLLATRSNAADAPAAAQSAAKPSLTVSLTPASSGQMPVTLLANGSVAAWQEASVGAQVSGLRIEELHAQVGDTVKRGQLLATLSSDAIEADLALARAMLAEATAVAAEASANADRARVVQGTGALSAQQINQFLTGEMTAKARVESAKAQRDVQQLRLNHTRIVAPDSGIVSAWACPPASMDAAALTMAAPAPGLMAVLVAASSSTLGDVITLAPAFAMAGTARAPISGSG